MKILQVITSMLVGGAEHLVVQLTDYLRKEGHIVDVCLLDGEETPFLRELQQTGCEVYKLSYKRDFYNPVFILKLRKLIKQYDIIHTHNSSPQLFTAIANLGMGRVLVTTEHNTTNRKRSNFLFSKADRWMYRHYKQIICISQKTKERLVAYLGNGKSPYTHICTIPNGVDTQAFAHAVPFMDSYPRDYFVITMVGAFRPQKDQKTLIDAIGLLPQEQYQLWLIGDGELHNEIYEYAKKSTACNSIKFWGNRNDVPAILKATDIVVMSSHWEGFGLAAVEGMAAGKPVIASDVDGLRQVVEGAGFIFPIGDKIKLAELILQLCTTPSFYNEVATRCYERAKQFDISKMVKSYLQVYEELMRG